ncbi:MAG TPA: N-acetyl-gamma-glutamyl-phosphate reductase [Acidiferrobacteraceae bacterium]|nr:N-acetyl-gamma-glutamyl-phosphate reductase [Acidiferrobacteraceae bacterium]
MIKVGIIGGTGYTGVELLRLLVMHPQVELNLITSRGEAGRRVSELFPSLRGFVDLEFSPPDGAALKACDLVFAATPNGVAMHYAPGLLEAGVRFIDLAADFRIKDQSTWEHWYGMEHACPELLDQAVYGLPEMNREQIANAQLIANPGCYPTAIQLGYLPVLVQDIVDPTTLIADAKSGVSGAGRGTTVANLFCEASESMKAYAVAGHRHGPEICQGLNQVASKNVGLTFVPHLAPMIRGIHATLYSRLKTRAPGQDFQALFEKYYQDEPFVDVLRAGSYPETRSVRGSNTCRIAMHQPEGGDILVVLSVIDNLVKGAAGQAVQNMNVMYGLSESTGLNLPPLLP